MEDLIRNIFELEIISRNSFNRNDTDTVINEFLTTSDGERYFLKEIQLHSMRTDFDFLYSALYQINSLDIKLVLPISHYKEPKKFIFEFADKKFLLFPMFEILPFNSSQYPCDKLLDHLMRFQNQIKNFAFEKQEFRNYESWLMMGIKRLRKKLNSENIFLDSFENFMQNRFPLLKLENGNIHWDIHQDNLGLTQSGELILLDFDLVQSGCCITDLAAALSLYIDWNNYNKEKIDKLILDNMDKLTKVASNINLNDIKFLTIRNILGEMALIESVDIIKAKLNNLINS